MAFRPDRLRAGSAAGGHGRRLPGGRAVAAPGRPGDRARDRHAGLPPAGPAAPRRRAVAIRIPTIQQEAVRDLCRTRAGRAHPGQRGRRLASIPTGRRVHGVCGLVPSEYSSGQRTWRGQLTKAGNAHLRTQPVRVGLVLPAPPRGGRPDRPAPAGPGPPSRCPRVGDAATTVRPVPPAGRPQDLQEPGRGRGRTRTRRVLVGRDDRLSRRGRARTLGALRALLASSPAGPAQDPRRVAARGRHRAVADQRGR